MSFRDYSENPSANTTLGDGTYIGPNMLRNKVRPALQQIAADGKALSVELFQAIAEAQIEQGPVGPPGEQVFVSARALTGVALNSNVDSGGGTDDTAVLQAALDGYEALNRRFTLAVDGVARVTGLDLPSNCTLYFMPGAGLFQANNSNRPLLQNKNPTRGIIVDHDIAVIGGRFNFNGANQSHHVGGAAYDGSVTGDPWVTGFAFHGVRGLKIMPDEVRDAKTFNIHVSNAEDVKIDTRVTVTDAPNHIYKDAVHCNGPLTDFDITVRGQSGDDFVALNADEGRGDITDSGDDYYNELGPFVGKGDITRGVVRMYPDEAKYGLRLLSKDSLIDGIKIEGRGTVRGHGIIAGQFPDGSAYNASRPGNIGHITFDYWNVSSHDFVDSSDAWCTLTGKFVSFHFKTLVKANVNDADAEFGFIVTGGDTHADSRVTVDTLLIRDTGAMDMETTALFSLLGPTKRVWIGHLDWLRDGTVPQTGSIALIKDAGDVEAFEIGSVSGNRFYNGVVVEATGTLDRFICRGADITDVPADGALLNVYSGNATYPQAFLRNIETDGLAIGGTGDENVDVRKADAEKVTIEITAGSPALDTGATSGIPSGVTDQGVGHYRVGFREPMLGYVAVGSVPGNPTYRVGIGTQAPSYCDIHVYDAAGAAVDPAIVTVGFNRG